MLMLSIERCKDILKSHDCDLTNEEIKQVREFLYLFAEIQINAEKEMLEDEEHNFVLPRQLRRAKDEYLT